MRVASRDCRPPEGKAKLRVNGASTESTTLSTTTRYYQLCNRIGKAYAHSDFNFIGFVIRSGKILAA